VHGLRLLDAAPDDVQADRRVLQTLHRAQQQIEPLLPVKASDEQQVDEPLVERTLGDPGGAAG
jgi:hypothetical protein